MTQLNNQLISSISFNNNYKNILESKNELVNNIVDNEECVLLDRINIYIKYRLAHKDIHVNDIENFLLKGYLIYIFRSVSNKSINHSNLLRHLFIQLTTKHEYSNSQFLNKALINYIIRNRIDNVQL